MNCRLVEATENDKNDLRIFDMLQDIGKNENGFENGGFGLSISEFGAYIGELVVSSKLRNIRPGRVPQTVFWLFDGDQVIGFSKMRHFLNEHLRRKGGHIGYGIRKSERGKGYGSILLGLTLEKIDPLGVVKVLITCDEANQASRRVIEKNGGVLEKSDGHECLYWIARTGSEDFWRLHTMTPSEYEKVRDEMIMELAKAKVDIEGIAEDEARSSSENEQDTLLSAGVDTRDNWLNTLKTSTGEIIGYSWLGRIIRPYGNVGFLFAIHIYQEYRGKGCGHILLREVERLAQKNGEQSIELYVMESNNIAKALYEKEGYLAIRANDKGKILSKKLG